MYIKYRFFINILRNLQIGSTSILRAQEKEIDKIVKYRKNIYFIQYYDTMQLFTLAGFTNIINQTLFLILLDHLLSMFFC